MFHLILDVRKRRDVHPTLAVLRECVAAGRATSLDAKSCQLRSGHPLGYRRGRCTEWHSGTQKLRIA